MQKEDKLLLLAQCCISEDCKDPFLGCMFFLRHDCNARLQAPAVQSTWALLYVSINLKVARQRDLRCACHVKIDGGEPPQIANDVVIYGSMWKLELGNKTRTW